jgi:exosortase
MDFSDTTDGMTGLGSVAAVNATAERQGTKAITTVSRPSLWTTFGRAIIAELRKNPIFWIGVCALVVPTMWQVATQSWDKDQGAHGPIVLATAIWIFARSAPQAALGARPPNGLLAFALLAPCVLLYAVARITGLMEVGALAAYLTIVATVFALGGAPVIRHLWFPIIYSAFLIPIPDTLIDVATQPVKLAISCSVVGLLAKFGYPVATSGVSIFIGQFELLIAAACAGLNSLISLTAIGTFYIYLKHNASLRYTLFLILTILPIAVFANFMRVLVLVLLTYYAGEAVAQGFLHEFAGFFLFLVSLSTILLLDASLSAVRRRIKERRSSAA